MNSFIQNLHCKPRGSYYSSLTKIVTNLPKVKELILVNGEAWIGTPAFLTAQYQQATLLSQGAQGLRTLNQKITKAAGRWAQ